MSLRELGETIRMALMALTRSPLRSGLTILGLAIGVGAYVAMTSLGQGAKRAVVDQFSAFGVDVVRVQSLVGDPGASLRTPRPLTQLDVDALRRSVTGAHRVVPTARRTLAASARGGGYFAPVVGTTPDYFTVKAWPAVVGGVFNADDVASRARVCVLGATPAYMLLDGMNAVGATLAIGDGLTCHVIGVLEPKGLNATGRDLDDLIVIPDTTFASYFGLGSGYAEIEIEVTSHALLGSVREEARLVMRRTHALVEGQPDDFRIASPSDAVKVVRDISTILTRLLAAIAAVSLLVGGIGIMNIQLVSVAERTREIGIRSAIGASPRQIMGQFLAEAVMLSSVGALLGGLAGVAGAWSAGRALHWANAVDVPGVVVAATLGITTGVIFGYAPARRAARLLPVDALRQE